MAKAKPRPTPSSPLARRESDISVAVMYPGNRIDRMATPLEATEMDVAIEPSDAYERDIVIADNADRDLGKEVLRKPFHGAQLVYRMRGDIYHELQLWDMHPVKHWAALNVVLPNVDGCIAVTEWMGEKFRRRTGLDIVGSAGLPKRVEAWPDSCHDSHELRLSTLTNTMYWKKVDPLLRAAPAIDALLQRVGGWWDICSRGQFQDRLETEMEQYSNIRTPGYVDAHEQLEKSNCMLHLSDLDGQPNAILEGLASGLPVVTNDFVAFTEFEGPIQVVNNHDELVRELRRLTDPTIRDTLGRKGQEYIDVRHSPKRIGQDYVSYFQELLQ